MGSTPPDVSPGSGDRGDSPASERRAVRSRGRFPVTLRRLLGHLWDRLTAAMGGASVTTREHGGNLPVVDVHGERGSSHQHHAPRSDGGITDLPRRRRESTDLTLATGTYPVLLPEATRVDPPDSPDERRLDVEQSGGRLELSQPGNPEAYLSSDEWIALER